MVQSLETDYLVVGAGAMGMAFADEIVRRTRDLRVVLVDRRAKTGGHWNDDYRFVRLHQPAAYYGVNSEVLGSGGEDLASGPKILAYYEQVIEKLCATGRVRFFPQCDYEGEGRFRSLVVEDCHYEVAVRRKIVDATYSKITVPSTRPPAYGVAEGMTLIPINGLSDLQRPWSRYMVIGAGKTGLDALLFLLWRGVDPDRISWIVSNDAWLFNRDYLQPELAARSLPRLLRTFAQASDASDFFRRAEAGKWGMRLDESIWPTRFRCATVSPEELQEIRRIKDVIRMGRVQRIEPTELVLDKGRVPTHADVLHIDCTACGLTRRPPVPVFAGDRITLQPLVMCQQLMSSALTAVIELKQDDEETKNAECVPVPHPELPKDYFSAVFVSTQNLEKWAIPYGWWLLRSRLTILHHVSWLGVLRLVFGLLRWEKAAVQAIERFHRELDE